MTYIPGLWVPVSAENRRGGAQPAFRWIHPVLARAGYEVFFANALSIVQAFHAPVAIISNIHGLSTAKQENGNRYVDSTREQDFEAYTLAKRAGILQETLMDNEALARVFGRFVEAGCEPIPYVGPWMRSTPPTRDAVAEALDPYINTDVCRVMVDGGGARNDEALNTLMDEFLLTMLIEPQAQRIGHNNRPLPESMRKIPSLTLYRTLEHPEDFHPEYPPDVTRWWLDNRPGMTGQEDAYWAAYDEALGKGFSPILPPIMPIWLAWWGRYGQEDGQ